MATKKEIKELLKSMNVTEQEMDNYWNELIETNWKIKSLSKSGKTWRDMNTGVIKAIPTQKQRDVAASEQKKKEEEEKAAMELKAKQEAEYAAEHYEEIMLAKIDSEEDLTEKELRDLVFEFESVETQRGENRRWTRTNTSIVKIKDRCFSIDWEQGLTENQPNEFWEQPYEVEKRTHEKTVTVTEWVEIKEENE